MEVDKRGKGNGKRVMEIDKKIGVTFLMTSSKSHPPFLFLQQQLKKY
ncbi:hypothetical protein CG09_0048 [Riemerella anatipestifer]|nr:hypothetical protein [Riemerella anatipestifer]AKP70350.1 hypothetical protein CG09_0048 [Riemerella anatipestifer]